MALDQLSGLYLISQCCCCCSQSISTSNHPVWSKRSCDYSRVSQPTFPRPFLHVIVSILTVCPAVCHTLMLFILKPRVVSCFSVMIWPFVSSFSSLLFSSLLFSSLLFSSPLLTFDLSDFETSVDSRCTTDSADSAFVRRYWFLASSFLFFFFFFLHLSSPIILFHPLPHRK